MDSWPSIIKSLVVVPNSHDHGLLKPVSECEAVNWDRSPMRDPLYAEQAVLIDHRPFDRKINATLVVWNSALAHCNGTYNERTLGKRTKFSPPLHSKGHFVSDMDLASEYAQKNGYCVLEIDMSQSEYNTMVDLYCRSVQLVNKATIDLQYPECPDITKITADHLPPYKTKGLQQYYGFCHTPFANAMREIPIVKTFFSKLYDCPEHALYCSLDASAVAMVSGSNDNWLHRDQTLKTNTVDGNKNCWQGTVYLKPPTKKYRRFAQMVAWHPTEDGLPNRMELEEYAKKTGACLTHNNHRVNKEANTFTGHLAMRTKKLNDTFKVFKN